MSPKGRCRALLFRSFSVAEGDVCAPEPMQMSATCLFHDSAERRNTVCSPFGRYSRAQPSPLLEGRRGAKIVRFFLNFTAFFFLFYRSVIFVGAGHRVRLAPKSKGSHVFEHFVKSRKFSCSNRAQKKVLAPWQQTVYLMPYRKYFFPFFFFSLRGI